MNDATSLTIKLLNKNYAIKCPKDEVDNLLQAVDRLNHHLSLKKSEYCRMDDYHLLLLAALQVSHELIIERTQHAAQNQQLSQLIGLFENQIK